MMAKAILFGNIILLAITIIPCATLAGGLILPDKNTQWDPFFVGHVDQWNITLGKYVRSIPKDAPSQAVRVENIRAIFASQADFNDYRSDCQRHPLRKVLLEIKTTKDKSALLSIVQDDKRKVDAGFLASDAIGLLPKIGRDVWPIAAVGVIRNLIDESEYTRVVKRTRADLNTLIAIGGQLEHEERLYEITSKKHRWMIYRAIDYRVKVGKENRLIPLCVDTIVVQIGE